MDSEQSSPQEMIEQTVRVVTGSAMNFIRAHGSHTDYNGLLMLNAWSQSDGPELSPSFTYIPSERENYLNEKVRLLEETLRKHADLLLEIHATSSLLDQQQVQMEEQVTMENNENDSNETNTVYHSLNRATESSPPPAASTLNSTQQISSSPAESVNYRIIAEGDLNEEPIEIQLAEETPTSNLNSSAESGRLEICLNGEENLEIKTEFNTISPQPTTSEHENFIKKRILAAINASSSSMEEESPIQKHCINSNSVPTTPIMHIKNNYNNIPTANGADFSPLIEADQYLENAMVSIGPNETRIPAQVYHNMNWASASNATRKLLMTIFGRSTLATHSMTGKPSPAFKGQGKPVKEMLDPQMIADIVYVVTQNCNVPEKVVKNAITSKCADENKTMKLRLKKRNEMLELNKENKFE